jgi:hypothetical protein
VNIHWRIIARRKRFKGAAVPDTEVDRLASADETDLHALAATPGEPRLKAKVLAATGFLVHTSPSDGEWAVLRSLMKELAASPNVA